MTRRSFLLVASLLIAALTGCRSEQFRSHMTLYSDGRVERSIYQPVQDTPAPAQKAEPWKKKETVQHQGRDYIKAEGTFASVSDLPDTLTVQRQTQNKLLQPLMPAAKLKRGYAKNDFVFVTEHRFFENLNDTISLDSVRQGREEITALGIDFAEAVFNELLGKEYDASELARWLRSDGKSWLNELTDYAFMQYLASAVAAAGSPKPSPQPPSKPAKKGEIDPRALEMLDSLAGICGRYGLKLRENGALIKDEKKLAKILEEFAFNLVCQKVIHRDTKKPVSRDTVLGWAAELAEANKPRPDKSPKSRIELASEKVIKEKFGGKDVFEMKAGLTMMKVAGVHFFSENRAFDYSLTMPGAVVETNGMVEGSNQVRWKFQGADAWLLGYPMNCRSLEANSELQKELLKNQSLSSTRAMLEFVDLVSQENSLEKPEPPALKDVLKQCRTEKSMAPLLQHRQNLEKPPPPGQVNIPGPRLERLGAVLKLLNLPQSGK